MLTLKSVTTQLCRWEFLVFSGNFETELTVEEDLPNGSVVFRLVTSSFMRQFEGRWQVTAARTSCVSNLWEHALQNK